MLLDEEEDNDLLQEEIIFHHPQLVAPVSPRRYQPVMANLELQVWAITGCIGGVGGIVEVNRLIQTGVPELRIPWTLTRLSYKPLPTGIVYTRWEAELWKAQVPLPAYFRVDNRQRCVGARPVTA
ncbi:hypothetical protein AALO_G00138610 [Alosa alosa]|uniref:Uncharacterized protein n=1 Tax=Alosa alosa TaxID=278164 RepID=A0AAV6GIR4_9TELE|nr:hypothetical protein AALO_G00138610 [Alosa alosa]